MNAVEVEPTLQVGRVFVDSNVLLYALDARNRDKNAAAQAWLVNLWQTGAGRLSWQVLNEFYVNATAKLGVAAVEARRAASLYSTWQPIDFTLGLLQRAWQWTDAAHVSYWDALILAAAERAGCSVLLSEDFQEGRSFGTVRVVSPFHTAPPATPGTGPER